MVKDYRISSMRNMKTSNTSLELSSQLMWYVPIFACATCATLPLISQVHLSVCVGSGCPCTIHNIM